MRVYVLLPFSEFSPKADVTYKNIKIQQDTTTTELVQLAMQKFGIEVILSPSFPGSLRPDDCTFVLCSELTDLSHSTVRMSFLICLLFQVVV